MSIPLVRISGSGSVVVGGFQSSVWVRMVFSIPAPRRVMPAFGSSGAARWNVPGAISIVVPSFPSRTAATSASLVVTGAAIAARAVQGRARAARPQVVAEW